MRIISWNVNGYDDIIHLELQRLIEELAPDVIMLQLTKTCRTTRDLSLRGYHIYHNPGTKDNYGGTISYCKEAPKQYCFGFHDHSFNEEGRIITLEYNSFYITNVYTPNIKPDKSRAHYRHDFDHSAHQFFHLLQDNKMVILCGDFNVVHKIEDTYYDAFNHCKPSQTYLEQDMFESLLCDGFTDLYRYFHPTGTEYTFWSVFHNQRQENKGHRIDYILVSTGEVQYCKNLEILQGYKGSSHVPLCLDLEIE